MPLPTSGPLSLQNIQTEFGGTNPIGLNEYYAGGGLVPAGVTGTNGAVPSSGVINIFNFYGTAAGILGETWSNLSTSAAAFTKAPSFNIVNIGYNGSIFLALTYEPEFTNVMTSTDGVNWSYVTNNNLGKITLDNTFIYSTGLQYRTLVWAGNKWFLMNRDATYYYSSDGITWAKGSVSGIGASTNPNITYIPGVNRYVMSSYNSKSGYSSDGITWTSSSVSLTAAFNVPNDGGTRIGGEGCSLTANGTRVVTFGYSANAAPTYFRPTAATTDDGITWTYRAGCGTAYGTGYLASPQGQSAMAHDGTVIASIPGINPTIMTQDGITYTVVPTSYFNTVGNYPKMTKVGSVYLAAGNNRIASSTNAIDWTTVYTATGFSLLYASGSPSLAVVSGTHSKIVSSTNGTTFTPTTSPASAVMNVYGMVKNAGLTIAVGNQGTCATSTDDGNTWTVQSGLAAVSANGTGFADFKGIAFNGTNYVAAGYGSTGTSGSSIFVCYSTDGITWTRPVVSGSSTVGVGPIVWNGTKFMFPWTGGTGGRNASMYYSTNSGISWAATSMATFTGQATNTLMTGLDWSPTLGLWLTTGGRNNFSRLLYTSPDSLLSWTSRATAFSAAYEANQVPYSLATSKVSSLVVVVGTGGSCATSTNGLAWTAQAGLKALTTNSMTSIAWVGSFFVASGAGVCATSTDGVTWVLRPNFTAPFASQSSTSSYYNGSTLFVLGTNGKIVKSP